MARHTSPTRRSSIRQALLAACVWLLPLHAAADDIFHPLPDFNGDGAADLVVGVPYEGYQPSSQGRAVREAGAVDVIYGTVSGSACPRPQHWTLASAGLRGTPREGDHFGFAVAWGRFAVKVFGPDAAGVFVAKGTVTQDGIFGASEPTEPGDGFGASLGAGGLPRISFKW